MPVDAVDASVLCMAEPQVVNSCEQRMLRLYSPELCEIPPRQDSIQPADERNTSSVKLTNTFIGQLASHWELDLPTESQGGGA